MDNLIENRLKALERCTQQLCQKINKTLQFEIKDEITNPKPQYANDVLIKWRKGSLEGYFVGFYGVPLAFLANIGQDYKPRWHIKIDTLDSIELPKDFLVIAWSELPETN